MFKRMYTNMKDFFKLREGLNEFLGHRIPSAGADSSGIRKATGADNKAPNTGAAKQSDDNKVKQIQNQIDSVKKEIQKHKVERDKYAEKADNGDHEADEIADKHHDRMVSLEDKVDDLEDKLKKAKDEFNKKNKK